MTAATRDAQVPEQLPQQDQQDQQDQEDQEGRAPRAAPEAWPGGGPDGGAGQPEPSSSFEDEVRSALSYEKGLAAKALVALALVAALIIARLLGF